MVLVGPGPGWPPVTARGLPGCNRAQNESFRKFGKSFFWPPWLKRRVWGVPPYIIEGKQTPNGARQEIKVLWDDNLASFSSVEIRAKI